MCADFGAVRFMKSRFGYLRGSPALEALACWDHHSRLMQRGYETVNPKP